jgi:hypothetical protein
MNDQNTLMLLAKLQTKVRNLEDDNKRYSKKLLERDEEIDKLKKVISDHELKEKMIAKNKSYLELKAQKDIEQIEENKKLQAKGNNETKTTNRRKK